MNYTDEMAARKSLAELNAIDNFMFNELMQQEDKDRTKRFVRSIIEPVIGKKIRNIQIESQKIVQGVDTDKHGIQMDAYVRAVIDTKTGKVSDSVDVTVSRTHTIYDIEPNKYKDDDKRRARFYRSVVDSRLFLSGKKYDELEDVVIIMLSTYDPFGLNRMLYTVRKHCVEEPDMEYDDGATTYFLYTKGELGIPSEKVRRMLHFLENSNYDNAKDAGMEDAMQMIDDIKKNSQIGVKYMHTWDYMNHMKMEAIESGLAEGMAQGITQGITQGIAQGITEGQNELVKAINMLRNGHTDEEILENGVSKNTLDLAKTVR